MCHLRCLCVTAQRSRGCHFYELCVARGEKFHFFRKIGLRCKFPHWTLRNFRTARCGIALYAAEIVLYAAEIALYAVEIALYAVVIALYAAKIAPYTMY